MKLLAKLRMTENRGKYLLFSLRYTSKNACETAYADESLRHSPPMAAYALTTPRSRFGLYLQYRGYCFNTVCASGMYLEPVVGAKELKAPPIQVVLEGLRGAEWRADLGQVLVAEKPNLIEVYADAKLENLAYVG